MKRHSVWRQAGILGMAALSVADSSGHKVELALSTKINVEVNTVLLGAEFPAESGLSLDPGNIFVSNDSDEKSTGLYVDNFVPFDLRQAKDFGYLGRPPRVSTSYDHTIGNISDVEHYERRLRIFQLMKRRELDG